MKRALQKIYWRGILLTLALAAVSIGLTAKIKIDDTRSHLSALLQAASRWTIDSNADLQSLADSIAAVSPHVRVTFILDTGLTLADSIDFGEPPHIHSDDPEIMAARSGEIGVARRFSKAEAAYVLYMAQLVSPQLILRVSYPVFEIAKTIIFYGIALVILIVCLNRLLQTSVAKFTNDQVSQLNEVRRLLEDECEDAAAIFPEFQPSLDAIAYRVRRLKEDRQEILRNLNMQNDFVANASHELRSPLTSVRGFAEMLGEGMAQTPEEQQLCIETIRSECDRMLKVIEDILRLEKAERSPENNSTSVSAKDIASEVGRSIEIQAVRKGIQVKIEGEARVCIAERDLWEIFYNLMDNAVRYGKNGGEVIVKMADSTIRVQDDGPGISPKHIPHIFEPFYRVDDTRDLVPEGSGLGLSIVRTIVEKNGGSIVVESEPGKGTTFTICLLPENAERNNGEEL